MDNILFIVGNGLSLDLREWAKPQLDSWNPSHPLKWNLYTPGKPNIPLLKSLPRFEKVISHLQQNYLNLSDFEIFEQSLALSEYSFINNNDEWFYDFLVDEMQHFLAIAYSHFQLEIDKIDLSTWPWINWFNAYGKKIHGITSFNYDLVLESALKQSGVSVRRFGLKSELEGIRTLKPHGSVDFDTASNAIAIPVGYPLQIASLNNNSSIKYLDRSKLLEPRTEADIVLPNEYSTQTDYQWIKPGYDWFKLNGSQFTHCIIAGLSYWNCDRPEIDFLLNSLSDKATIIVANIKPPQDLIRMLKARFNNVIEWINGPEL